MIHFKKCKPSERLPYFLIFWGHFLSLYWTGTGKCTDESRKRAKGNDTQERVHTGIKPRPLTQEDHSLIDGCLKYNSSALRF